MRFATLVSSKEWRNGKSVTKQRCLVLASHAAASRAINKSNVLKNTNNDDPCWPRSNGAAERTTRERSNSAVALGWIAATPADELINPHNCEGVGRKKEFGLRGGSKVPQMVGGKRRTQHTHP